MTGCNPPGVNLAGRVTCLFKDGGHILQMGAHLFNRSQGDCGSQDPAAAP